MTTIVTRTGKGSSLSWTEVDANFTNLNTDKAEVSVVNLKAPTHSPSFTGTVSGISATDITLTPTGNISSTNTQAGIAELDAKKAALAGADFSGNVSIPKTQMGVSSIASENTFWDGSVPNQLTLKRGTPASPGAELLRTLGNIVSIRSNPLFISYVSIGTPVTNATWTQLAYNQEALDVASNYNPTLSLFTVPVIGVYHFIYAADQGGGSTSGEMLIRLTKNGSTVIGQGGGVRCSALNPVVMGTCYVSLSVGDIVQVQLFQSTGATMTTGTAGYFQGSLVREA